MISARRILVTGRVQQVGYRDWAVRTARGLGLTGWVRNRSDGSVELHAVGPEDALDRMAEACREGPPLARVANVETQEDSNVSVKGFTKRFGA